MTGDADIFATVYGAGSEGELKAAYEAWAQSYDADLDQAGYRAPAVAAALIGRHIAPGAAPLLDAGCGTGLIGEILATAGCEEIIGLDLSPAMLEAAAAKGCYDSLRAASLLEPLAFPDGHFAAVTAVGVLTKGHVGPAAFGELIRATRAGGRLVFSIRVDGGLGAAYLAAMDGLEAAGRWRRLEMTPAFASLPRSEPEVRHSLFAYEIP